MTNTSNNRRAFLRRSGTGVAAALAVPTLAALASNSKAAQACTPVPWLQEAFRFRYAEIAERIQVWVNAGIHTQSATPMIRQFALADYIDDWCGTGRPRIPIPIPPDGPTLTFEAYADQLEGMHELAKDIEHWAISIDEEGILPGLIALHVLRDDAFTQLSYRPAPDEWPFPFGPLGPHPC
ncbi:MAG: hypothetical protein GFH27_549303n100 [Chloroflexi bacterium AL-W]|nr:hypothetical protein [Chloroflexi bacterium AL-N1]NOK67985.1 hypothetical protein [Chloroflexi bacterium AL-N10]NOK73325.1 hypothetical protein [Chloroflexi bacterium AL-N5]NOK83239.1 hypothetical protein [Chloroflexi bacterium AL-W]NOK87656.1 hypothetical protein [Chloroflexi bacterium AL-N15]